MELYLTSFHLRLCAPTSTSDRLEVAINFAASEGLIITFKNSHEQLNPISRFYCGWISRYKEENEYLWMGGHYQLYVSTINKFLGKRSYELVDWSSD